MIWRRQPWTYNLVYFRKICFMCSIWALRVQSGLYEFNLGSRCGSNQNYMLCEKGRTQKSNHMVQDNLNDLYEPRRLRLSQLSLKPFIPCSRSSRVFRRKVSDGINISQPSKLRHLHNLSKSIQNCATRYRNIVKHSTLPSKEMSWFQLVLWMPGPRIFSLFYYEYRLQGL